MEGFAIPNVEVLTENNIYCGITVKADSDAEVGTWTLISREFGNRERRFEFTIDVQGTYDQLNTRIGSRLRNYNDK